LLRALVSVNRAHAGVLYLASPEGDLIRTADYGFESMSRASEAIDHDAAEFAAQLATERRSRSISDLRAERRLAGSVFALANLHSILGVPLIDDRDRLLGVALIGLLVPHHFTRTEIARVEAFASRAAAMIYSARGIDERESALNIARAMQRRLESVIAAMPEAVLLVDPPEGRVIAENQAAVSLLGRSLGENPTSTWPASLLLPDGTTPDRDELPIQTTIRTGEVVSGMELLVRGPGGVDVPVLVSAAPVKDPGGPTMAVVAVFREIAALKEASRLKDEFVSVVSHELRSPLTPIRGFVQLVARDLTREGGHEPQVKRLNSIAGQVDRMTRLVDDLLDVSRLKAGSLEIRHRRADIIELAEEVVRDRDAANASHQLVLIAEPEPVVGDWDSDRLYQVLDNLIGNAMKYSPPGGTITVKAGSDPATGDALVSVADEGPGISPADRERIFSAFYRSRDASASQIAGLGLGLYICQELVAAHGGRIEVGDAPVHGAEFTVRLPRVTPVVTPSAAD
jgi:signal transduction histidine kinase